MKKKKASLLDLLRWAKHKAYIEICHDGSVEVQMARDDHISYFGKTLYEALSEAKKKESEIIKVAGRIN